MHFDILQHARTILILIALDIGFARIPLLMIARQEAVAIKENNTCTFPTRNEVEPGQTETEQQRRG
jgi:hypothetical protein